MRLYWLHRLIMYRLLQLHCRSLIGTTRRGHVVETIGTATCRGLGYTLPETAPIVPVLGSRFRLTVE
jgi:hypothetical protein